MDPALASFLDYSQAKLRQNCAKIERAVAQLSAEETWAKGSQSENSVGNLLLHLAGNVRQWIQSSLGGSEDRRDRDSEFAALQGPTPDQLLARLRDTVEEACAVISGLSAGQLAATHKIQTYEVSGIAAVYHVVEHFSYHTGQIAFITKQLRQQDLGFYSHLGEKGLHAREGDRIGATTP